MLRIINGEVYDPINNIHGAVREICVGEGKIVASVGSCRTIDAAGMIVMPGGVDMHCHIAGPKVNAARKMRPEDHRLNPLRRTSGTRSGVGNGVHDRFRCCRTSAGRPPRPRRILRYSDD
jgi:formylmethanofuran dehydrogenase subunit A